MQDHRTAKGADSATTLQLSSAEAAAIHHVGEQAATSVLERYFNTARTVEERMIEELQAATVLMRGGEEHRLNRAVTDDIRIMDALWDSIGQTAHMAMTATVEDWGPDSQAKWRKAWQLEADVMHRLTD